MRLISRPMLFFFLAASSIIYSQEGGAQPAQTEAKAKTQFNHSNFEGTKFSKAGLTYKATKALQKKGYSDKAIIEAASDIKELELELDEDTLKGFLITPESQPASGAAMALALF